MTVELRHLEFVLAVAETGSVSRAAGRLHMTQPPLTRQLSGLERDLGVRLFIHSRSGTSLTDAGRALAAAAPGVLRAFSAALTAARTAEGLGADAVRLGYATNMAHAVTVPLSRSAARQQPPLQISPEQLARDEQLARLRAGTLEIGLFWSPLEEPDLVTRRVRIEPMVVVLPEGHRLASAPSLPLPALADETWIVDHNRGGLDRRTQLRRACRAAGFTPHLHAPTHDLQESLALVAAEQGVLAGPAATVALLPPHLVAVTLTGWTVELLAVVPAGPRPAAPVQQVLDLLVREFRDDGGDDSDDDGRISGPGTRA